MADCCEPGCSDEALCPVHQALADLRAKVAGLGHPLDCALAQAWDDATNGGMYPYIGPDPETVEECDCLLGDVLALIDKEAERG